MEKYGFIIFIYKSNKYSIYDISRNTHNKRK